ncbi:RHS repeat domain-containing protein, partial [Xanthomarina spongicola]
IAKSNTDTNHATHFYIDNVYASTGEPDIVEENNYYPFGLKHKGYGAPTVGVDHKYGFGGKEEQDEMELNMLDFGWRNYDAAIGRWMNIDPLGELKYELTPYNYVQNSPMFRIDPDGLTDYKVNKKTGEVNQVGDENKDPDRIVKTDRKGNVKKKGEGLFGFLTKKSEKGKSKIAVSGLDKGILADGKNLKTESTVVEVELGSNLQDKSFEKTILKISDYLDVELAGYYVNDIKSGKDYGYLHNFGDNDAQNSNSGRNFLNSNMPNLAKSQLFIKASFHTHLTRFDADDRLKPSSTGSRGGDLGSKMRALEINPTQRFFILTNPNRKEYTNY